MHNVSPPSLFVTSSIIRIDFCMRIKNSESGIDLLFSTDTIIFLISTLNNGFQNHLPIKIQLDRWATFIKKIYLYT